MQEQLKQLKIGGKDKLHVLTDFDRTLTLPIINGKRIPSLISVLRDNDYLTPGYRKKAHELFDKYHAHETDEKIHIKEKRMMMAEWWAKHFELLIASGLTRQVIQKAMRSHSAQLRTGADIFFTLLEKENIPLIIMSSSGLGIESISYFLEAEGQLKNNVHIISNQFEWSDDDLLVGYKKPIIHALNKDETLLTDFPEIHALIENRKNVLLIGDNEGDMGMVEGFDYDNLYTIGFGPHTLDFSMSLPQEADMFPVIKVLEEILN